MPVRTEILVVIAALGLIAPLAFLIVLVIAAVRRNRGHAIGHTLGSLLAATGGLGLGTGILVMTDDLLIVLPIPLFIVAVVVSLWRRRQRVYAAWLGVGFVMPWTILSGYYVTQLLFEGVNVEPATTWLGFLAGVVPVAIGLFVIAHGDPAPPAPNMAAPAGQPGTRAYGNIATAILDPGMVGPFRLPDVLALVAFILAWGLAGAIVSFVVPGGFEEVQTGSPGFVISILAGIAASVVATEVHLRAHPERGRRAFEAFSWYGEQEQAAIQELSGRRFPSAKFGVRRWLDTVPDRDDLAFARAEALSYLGRHDEAKAMAERIPASDPEGLAMRLATQDLVDFMAGGEGYPDELRAVVEAIPGADGDARLRGEVILASAETRRRMADGRATPGDAIEPLLAVRQRLGHRADGQMARVLRPRLLRAYLAASVLVAIAYEVSSRLEA